jgi:hypothetical protein
MRRAAVIAIASTLSVSRALGRRLRGPRRAGRRDPGKPDNRRAPLAHRGVGTRLTEVADGFVMPGFIDNHTHFARAGPAGGRTPTGTVGIPGEGGHRRPTGRVHCTTA